MTVITWDDVGTRVFQTGIDRGVLYVAGQDGVPWNGLSSVEEAIDQEKQSHYFDGIKHLEYQSAGDYSGKLTAFTYPDEFNDVVGIRTHPASSGFLVYEQPPKSFGLSYRTKLGNDVNGVDLGYRITLLYRLLATPDANVYKTFGSQVSPIEFSWDLSGTPVTVPGFRPTTQISFDSTKINSQALTALETILYGSTTAGPRLPLPTELASILASAAIITITDNGDGTWTAAGPSSRITNPDSGSFQITSVDAVFIDSNTYEVSTTFT